MNSKERHEARYQRRRAKRLQKKMARAEIYSEWGEIFDFVPLLNAYRQVAKASKDHTATQTWMSNLAINTRSIQIQLENGTWKTKGFNKFTIMERGKLRQISSVHISEKGIQNALCNYCLIPILRPSLIYDNGASLKGKGTDFSLDRFEKHLKDHYKKYGLDGYIYFFDFSGYFANINLDILVENISHYIFDEKIMNLYKQLIYAYKDGGLGLGSQVSQISAVFYPNLLDHIVKDVLNVHGYGRYMDDGYIICNDLDRMKEIVAEFENVCDKLGIVLNKKKCHIVRFDKQYIFLKTRFFVTSDGKVVRRLGRTVAKKERNRLKAFRKFYEMGLMTKEQIYLNFHAWLLSLHRGANYHTRKNMIKYYNEMFPMFENYFPLKAKNKDHKVLLHLSKECTTKMRKIEVKNSKVIISKCA